MFKVLYYDFVKNLLFYLKKQMLFQMFVGAVKKCVSANFSNKPNTNNYCNNCNVNNYCPWAYVIINKINIKFLQINRTPRGRTA